jgi:anti-sigma regulatory factor (Ser/Thr protein kinase)
MSFKAYEVVVEALKENLGEVSAFVDSHLEEIDCPVKAQMQLDIAVEELFVNIANYAYAPDTGKATIRLEINEEPLSVSITFIDNGVPYDPLAKADPDITLSAEERAIGGLGIFMVKKSMDDMFYEYKDSQNVLTIVKKLN